MQTFTGFEYLLIDVANAFGLDKENYDVRLDWAKANLNELEDLADQADDYYLYRKSVMALRETLEGKPTGHLVGFDAVCSGMQIMSAITGCKIGAKNTGLIDPTVRADAYTKCLEIMRQYIPTLPNEERKKVKNAVMTSLYGSIKQPEGVFGEDSEELRVFKKALYKLAPGACTLLETLRNTWRPDALYHSWKLPDGFDVKVKVMVEKEARIEVDELGGRTFTYKFKENEPKEKGVSNIANVIHSIDAYMVRSIERRCNYDPEVVERAESILAAEYLRRFFTGEKFEKIQPSKKFDYYLEQYDRSTVADVVILPYLTLENASLLSCKHLDKLISLVDNMLAYKPFPIITVHDEFKCHPNNMNHLRFQYKEILADLAESEILLDLLIQLYGRNGSVPKYSQDLPDLIRQSNYAIC